MTNEPARATHVAAQTPDLDRPIPGEVEVMQAFARSIVETVRHPLLVLDEQLRVVVANPSFYRTFGGTSAATVGHGLFEIDGGRWNQPRLQRLLEDVIPQDRPFKDIEIEYDCPHLGRRVMVLDAHRVVRDEDGTPMVLLSMEDDTERRRVRNELRRLNTELERRDVRRSNELETANRELLATNRELESFCFSVSHDLRTPLRAMDGFSQELLQRYAERLDEQGQHYLRRIRAGTQRMGQLIDDLLKLSRVTRSEMRHEHVDLTALAESVLVELREREPGRNVTFTARPGMVAEGDPPLIRVVLENLLGNAWKFTAKKPAALIDFDCAEIEGRPAFVIRDDGAGFDMEFAGKLFGAFQRLHSDREFTGTGIGLATVQRVVHRHGGEIRAEGAVGRGAAFSFTLPGSEHCP
jgi:PAS domain S-box-containing protein